MKKWIVEETRKSRESAANLAVQTASPPGNVSIRVGQYRYISG